MELVEVYSEIWQEQAIPGKRESQNIREWDAFHEADGHTISMFAGRVTGKTYSLARRALSSNRDCIVFAPTDVAALEFSRILNIVHRRTPSNIRIVPSMNRKVVTFSDGRKISIYHANRNSRNLNDFRGISVEGKDILIDEFEHVNMEGIVDTLGEYNLSKAAHIIAVGSLTTLDDSFSKRWFRASEDKFYMDMPYRYIASHILDYESCPSRFKEEIESEREDIDE